MTLVNTPLHGIELDQDKKPQWLRFGILRLLYHLYGAKPDEPSVQDWLKRLHSEEFRHQVSHFLQYFWKFERAAAHAARCREAADGALGRFSERVNRGEEVPLSDSDRFTLYEANADLPLFLDVMMFYLAIQADSYAKLLPYFYEDANAGIHTRSFSKQLGWFCNDKPDFDRAYASILKANRAWVDQLVGWNNGLRDVVTHEGGMLAIGWAKPQGGPIEPRTALYSSSGEVEGNVFGALQAITAGWFAFLDAAWRHFVPRLSQVGVLLTMSVNDVEMTRYVNCREEELRGFWVYPAFTNTGL